MRSLVVLCLVLFASSTNLISGSLISLNFVKDYMKLSGLKDPMFIMKLSDLESFIVQVQGISFDSIASLCYEEGKFDYLVYERCHS